MAKHDGTVRIKVRADLDDFRAALLEIADEFEHRIDAAISRAATLADNHPGHEAPTPG